MDYKELVFTVSNSPEFYQDLLINSLSEIGFDTFEETDTGFKAYISVSEFDQLKLDHILESFKGPLSFSYEENLIRQKNWNEEWENNFQPLSIDGRCYVRATFHEPHPEYPIEIVIDPKMAFGTGHHQTTSMMMQFLLEEDVKEKTILDMGCGTGILAILAEKLGANELVAIDYDAVCYESVLENAQLNSVKNLTAICGSKEVIPPQRFDIILANINRNILLDQISTYGRVSKPGSTLLMSGFYENPDLELIVNEAKSAGFIYKTHKVSDNWVAVKFVLSL